MKKIKASWRDGLGRIAYAFLNLLFAVAVLLSIVVFSTPSAAFVLVFLSKWRVFAVKPRFWLANISSNLVDFIFGLSYVVAIMQVSNNNWLTLLVIFLAYVAWLLFIKPRSSQNAVIAQGLITLYFGLNTVFMLGFEWDAWFVILFELMVCVVSIKHILSTFDVKAPTYYVYLITLINIELLWLLNSWVVVYPVLGSGLVIVQSSLVVLLVNVMIVVALYKLFKKPELSWRDPKVSTPILLCLVTIMILLIFLSWPIFGQI